MKVLRLVQMYIDKYSRNRLQNKYVSTLIVMPSVNLMFPKQYFGHQDPQFPSITLLVAELYRRNHPIILT